MWTANRQLIDSQPIHKISIFNDHQQLTYRQVIQLWQHYALPISTEKVAMNVF